MSNLRPVEKKLFEDLFNMSSGYVLDFSDRTFSHFFREVVNVDIDSPRYGCQSKAKRMRAFWELEPDNIVGKVLSEMIELWKYDANKGELSASEIEVTYQEAQKIISRLTGKVTISVTPEEEFLSRQYKAISLQSLRIDGGIIPILESRLDEAQRCLANDLPLSTIFLTGSILEGILFGTALQHQKEFNQASCAPQKDGKTKKFHDWTLAQFIDVAYELGFLKLDVKKFSHELRDFRNYIHAYVQMASKFSPDNHTAEICLQVLKAAVASLTGDRK